MGDWKKYIGMAVVVLVVMAIVYRVASIRTIVVGA